MKVITEKIINSCVGCDYYKRYYKKCLDYTHYCFWGNDNEWQTIPDFPTIPSWCPLDDYKEPGVIRCGKCNGEMSLNPHPLAGKPPHYLEVGTQYECIPCTIKNRHGWAERAMNAENELAKSKQQIAQELFKEIEDESIKRLGKDTFHLDNWWQQLKERHMK